MRLNVNGHTNEREEGDQAENTNQNPVGTDGRASWGPPKELSQSDVRKIGAAVRALPPLSDDQIDQLCEVIRIARARWRREEAEENHH